MENATLIAEDPIRDIALLKINSPRSTKFLTLEYNQVPTGTSCGSLGFPLSEIIQNQNSIQFNLIQRFQGSYISSYRKNILPTGENVNFYEIDSLMYSGSSGCPGFITNSNVIGMQSQSVLGKGLVKIKKPVSKNVTPDTQLAISLWVPSMDIITFAKNNKIQV